MPLAIDINGGTLPEVEATADRIKKQSNLGDQFKTTNPPTPTINISSNSTYSSDFGKTMQNGDGFYYDQQINNELISVSLHPNTVTSNGGITWDPVDKSECFKGDVESTEFPYRIKPLCRSILSEDYQVAASNTWSEFGSDALGNFFNSFKPYAPYAQHLAEAIDKANSIEDTMKVGKDEDRSAVNSSVGKVLDSFTDKIYGVVKNMPSLLNRNLVAQGARFSYYSGTGVGFGNLSMKFTVFADWKEDSSNKYGNYKFTSINDQLEELYPYCFGKYVKALDENGNITGTEVGKETLGEFIDSHKDDINKYFGWQLPPGGYLSKTKDIDEIQYGTLKLKFGAFYSIPNLVIENAQFQFSKQMVKYWDSSSSSNQISPLYCDVILTFRPATKFTDEKLREFINGSSMETERSLMETILQDKLEESKKLNENILNNR